MTKQLDDILGLQSVPQVIDSNLPVVQEQQIENDVEYARQNLYDAVSKSQQAVEDMLQIAQQSQHPKAYEVLNAAIKTMADVSMGLADLQMKKQRLVGKLQSNDQEKTINNNLFVGSTAELRKMLESMKDGNG